MTSESSRRKPMETAIRTDYVGAQLQDEHRVMLVSIDPERPWDAFRRLRRAVRRERKHVVTFSLVDSDGPLDHQADVIPLASRREAG